MSKRSKASVDGGERALAAFRQGLAGWSQALDAHRMAPPDTGFGARLAALAEAAGEQARVYRAGAADYEWVPYSAGKPPYELQPDTGRRGPRDLWKRFDTAVEQLGAATEGENMLTVAAAYETLAATAAKLAQAIDREDTASSRPRTRARRTA